MPARKALRAACERALVASARAQRAGSRQQLRAAARRFVRRHRRDAGYLAWVLRSVGASSALAVALLGFAGASAQAKVAPFSGPLQIFQNVGSESAPALGDLDGDGDLDLVSGNDSGVFVYFENTGGPTSTAFVPAANPLAGQSVGFNSIPSLGDLDGDGDLDLVSGERSGTFFYFENTGSATSPTFAARTGTANPLNGKDVGIYSTPSLGDLDGDGDLDLVAGEAYYGSLLYFENTGSATHPAFVRRTGSANPLLGKSVGVAASVSLGDLDRDGDLDVVTGENFGTFSALENTGSATSPAFVVLTGAANPLAGVDLGYHTQVSLGDLDRDGDADLVSGKFPGTFDFFINQQGSLFLNDASNPLAGQDAGSSSAPALGDLDGDGDLDLVSGNDLGTFAYFENTGSAASPAFLPRLGFDNPFVLVDLGSNTTPALGDLDGDLDLVSGSSLNTLSYFENTGGATSPAFVQRTGATNPVNFPVADSQLVPALGDLDGDEDLDLLFVGILSANRTYYYWENTGGATAPAFVAAPAPLSDEDVGLGSVLSFGDLEGDGDLDLIVSSKSLAAQASIRANTGSATAPAFSSTLPILFLTSSQCSFGDLDGDGDIDLIAGSFAGTFSYYESAVAQSPRAIAHAGAANPLNGRDVGALSAPALADLDRDGDPDLVAGEDYGTFLFFENTGGALVPSFAARSGTSNPLNGRDVGAEARPAFADLDGDGDFDLLAGRAAGDFDYFENTGDAETPLFAAALANPFGLAGIGSHSAPTLGDVDGDGDLDLLVGAYYGAFAYFENTGSRTAPAFVLRTGAASPLDGFDPSYFATPALGDFDSDGDLDLVSGREHGHLFYFQNAGKAIGSLFTRLTGAANPLAGADVGQRSAPAAADLNGDGTPDLVTGALSGTFGVHYLPEPRHGLLLGAGIALLSLLERLRLRGKVT